MQAIHAPLNKRHRATWNGTTNRAQMLDCANLIGHLVPMVVEIMMAHAEAVWGEACYRVVK